MEIAQRIQWIIQHFRLSNASFADKIGVQRSTISHILSGRNSASLDFVTKIINHFPDVNVNWLITGQGEPLKNEGQDTDREIPSGNKHIAGSAKGMTESVLVLRSDGTFKQYNKLPNE